MTVVDTSVWVDYFRAVENAQTLWLEQKIPQQGLALTDLVLTEILQGIREDSHFLHVRRELSRFTLLYGGDEALALASAENYRFLRKRGITLRKTIDCLIATFCIREGHSLLHRDADFTHFERHLGLLVVHPQTH